MAQRGPGLVNHGGGHVGTAHPLGTETKFHGLSHHKMAKDWRLQVLKKTTCLQSWLCLLPPCDLGQIPSKTGVLFLHHGSSIQGALGPRIGPASEDPCEDYREQSAVGGDGGQPPVTASCLHCQGCVRFRLLSPLQCTHGRTLQIGLLSSNETPWDTETVLTHSFDHIR